jgi:uncharacterized iron-regulated protein
MTDVKRYYGMWMQQDDSNVISQVLEPMVTARDFDALQQRLSAAEAELEDMRVTADGRYRVILDKQIALDSTGAERAALQQRYDALAKAADAMADTCGRIMEMTHPRYDMTRHREVLIDYRKARGTT